MDKLTKKQKGFVKDYLETGNGTQSALKNYDTKDYKTASVISAENLDKPSIQEAIKSIAEQIPDEDLVEKHRSLLKQKQLAYFTFSKEMSDGEIITHVNEAGFEVIVIRPSDKGKLAFYSIDDAQAISKGLDMAYKIKGTYAPEKSINLDITADITNPQAQALAEEYELKLKQSM